MRDGKGHKKKEREKIHGCVVEFNRDDGCDAVDIEKIRGAEAIEMRKIRRHALALDINQKQRGSDGGQRSLYTRDGKELMHGKL